MANLTLINIGRAQNVKDADGSDNLFNTNIKIYHSEIVNDDFYIYISLPDDYENSKETYPVLFVLDGDVEFGMATSIARYLQIGDAIPELIIIGVGYGALNRAEGNKRRRDYTISSTPGASNSGGGPKFLGFMKKELIPYLDKTYRTNPEDRIISGYSLGGLFSIYTMLTEPGTFQRYIIGSPLLTWDNFRIFNIQEEAFKTLDDIKAKIFISVGSEESDEKYFNPIDEMVTSIEEKGFKSLLMEAKVFDGGTHLVCPPEVLSYGLVSVFRN